MGAVKLTNARTGRRPDTITRTMRPLLKTNDLVLLSFAKSLLGEAQIEWVVFDENASVMDGSLGIMPRRLMVADDDFARADLLLRQTVPESMPD